MALAHPPPLAGAGRGGGSPRPGRLSHAPPLACLVGRRDPPPWSSPARGEETRRAGPRVNPKAARTDGAARPLHYASHGSPHPRLAQGRMEPILPREAGEGDRPHRASKDARLSTGYEDGGGGERSQPTPAE